MKMLLDQGLPVSAARLLRGLGMDTVHTGECGLARASDAEILRYAEAQGRVLVSLDADFHALLARTRRCRPSVIRIRIEGLRAEGLAVLVRHVVARCEDDLSAGCVISVQQDCVRLRRLPIGA